MMKQIMQMNTMLLRISMWREVDNLAIYKHGQGV